MNELKPCPFCGGEAKIAPYKDVEFLVHNADCFTAICRVCGCGTSYEPSESKAIAAWNRRPAPRELTCEGCRYNGVRHQKCTCCARNTFMKDAYDRKPEEATHE